ncbi:MAG: RodZ domain-containing protein [Pacificimonas sp.]
MADGVNDEGEPIQPETPPEPAAAETHAHIGETLRAARLEQDRELSEIAEQTRVPLRHLAAIESGEHEELPALPYTMGFVKNYARAVGLDPEATAAQFRQESRLVAREPSVTILEPIDERRAPPRAAIFLGIGLLAIVMLFGYAWADGWFGGVNDVAEVEDDPLVIEEVATGIDRPEVAEPVETVAAPDPESPEGAIVLTANEDAWIRVSETESGQSLFQGVLTAGQTYEVPEGRDDLVLRTGRAGALDITVGGTPVPKLGGMADVVGDVPLTGEGLVEFTSNVDTDEG